MGTAQGSVWDRGPGLGMGTAPELDMGTNPGLDMGTAAGLGSGSSAAFRSEPSLASERQQRHRHSPGQGRDGVAREEPQPGSCAPSSCSKEAKIPQKAAGGFQQFPN